MKLLGAQSNPSPSSFYRTAVKRFLPLYLADLVLLPLLWNISLLFHLPLCHSRANSPTSVADLRTGEEILLLALSHTAHHTSPLPQLHLFRALPLDVVLDL
ncbi:hypothetical protein BDV98DRAFT_560030, partial [Pterulicium gracile]